MIPSAAATGAAVAHHRPGRTTPASRIVLSAAFVAFLAASAWAYGSMNLLWTRPRGAWAALYWAKGGIETIASAFAVFYALVALTYRSPRALAHPAPPPRPRGRVAVAYLCCEDLDSVALQSVVEGAARHSAHVVLHDDSGAAAARERIDAAARALEERHGVPVRVLRRPHRVGGKPGAVNNVLRHLPPDVEFLLLCDNDSFLPRSDFLDHALSYFEAPEVAVVQFRNVGYVDPSATPGYRTLSTSVDFYDAFVSFLDRVGWSPFLGHNALLRVSVMREVGGFTPGQLADDIDYSVKLRLRGYAIRYAREIAAEERHPLTYESLRRRTQKWAYGCTQILMRWAWPVLRSRGLSPADKVTFFLTVGYYHFQILLLGYLFIFYVCLPFHEGGQGGVVHGLVSAGLILFFTFVPSITYFVRNGALVAWPRAAVYWGITYGSQDFVMLRAALGCLLRRRLAWSPTNGAPRKLRRAQFVPEVLFAASILAVAAARRPALLLLPTTFLFVGKFLLAPYLDAIVFRARPRGAATSSPSA